MAPPKSKNQKMSLADFLSDESTGSWADEVATLPTAPAPRGDNYEDERRSRFGSRGGYGGGYDRESRGDRFDNRDPMRSPNRDRFDQREARPPVPLPTEPPFTAHIGNLSFDVTEDDLAEFFSELKISNIRVLKDRDEKPKGFGYIEFEDLESLKTALTLSSENLKSRPTRVNIAEPPREREDRTASNSWRRDTPLPSSGAGPSRDRYGDRGERGGFGDRSDRGGFGDRSDRGGFRDRFSDRSERHERGGHGHGDRQRDTSWSGGAFSNKRDDRPPRDAGAGERGDRNDRRGSTYSGSRDVHSERPRLALQPRTSTPVASPSLETTPRSPKADPFGAAKPVDAEEAWKRTEERRKQREAAKRAEEQQKTVDAPADA